MKILAIATTTALAALMALPASAANDRAEKGQAELAEMLEGRVAGEARSCIYVARGEGLDVVDRTAVVYERGDTIWVSRPSHPQSLDDDDILVIERYSGQLCRHDVKYTLDRTGGFYSGNVFLGDFVPYRRADG